MRLTDEQIVELRQMFPACPNPKYYPKQFMHYVRMFLYCKGEQMRVDAYV